MSWLSEAMKGNWSYVTRKVSESAGTIGTMAASGAAIVTGVGAPVGTAGILASAQKLAAKGTARTYEQEMAMRAGRTSPATAPTASMQQEYAPGVMAGTAAASALENNIVSPVVPMDVVNQSPLTSSVESLQSTMNNFFAGMQSIFSSTVQVGPVATASTAESEPMKPASTNWPIIGIGAAALYFLTRRAR